MFSDPCPFEQLCFLVGLALLTCFGILFVIGLAFALLALLLLLDF